MHAIRFLPRQFNGAGLSLELLEILAAASGLTTLNSAERFSTDSVFVLREDLSRREPELALAELLRDSSAGEDPIQSP